MSDTYVLFGHEERPDLRRQHRRHDAGLLAAPARLHPDRRRARHRFREGGYKVDIRGAALDVVERMGLLDEDPCPAHRRAGPARSSTATGQPGRQHGRRQLRRARPRRRRDHARRPRPGSCTSRPRRRRVHLRRLHRRASTSDARASPSTAGRPRLRPGHRRRRTALQHPRAGLRARGAASSTTSGYNVSIFSVPNHLGLDREELTYVGPGRTALLYSTPPGHRREGHVPVRAAAAAYDHGDRAEQQQAPGRGLSRARAGRCRACWRPCRRARLLLRLHQPGAHGPLVDAAGSRWSATRPTAPRPPPARAPASRWSARTCWRASSNGAGGDHTDAFPAYEARMRPFVEANQKLGPANIKRMVLSSRSQVRLSMLMLRLVGLLPARTGSWPRSSRPSTAPPPPSTCPPARPDRTGARARRAARRCGCRSAVRPASRRPLLPTTEY